MKPFHQFGILFVAFLLNFQTLTAAGAHSIIVTVLHASNEGADINLDNDAYRDKLIQLFSYTSYNQVTQQKVSMSVSDTQKLTLPQGYELSLSLKAEEQGKILVQASIIKANQQLLDTTLSILKPGVVFLGGPPVDKGDLVLVLEAL